MLYFNSIHYYLSLKNGVVSGSGSANQRYGSANTDPFQNVTDPEHWLRIPHHLNADQDPALLSKDCGSAMFIQNPNFPIPGPGSRVKKTLDSGTGSATKNISIFNPKNLYPVLSYRKYV
jgi:hypothetical protein